MADLPDILDHTVLQPGEWLILEVDPATAPESLVAMGDHLPDGLRSRVVVVAGKAHVLREEPTDA